MTTNERILFFCLDGLDLEVEANERKDKTFQILDQVVEGSQTISIPSKNQVKN